VQELGLSLVILKSSSLHKLHGCGELTIEIAVLVSALEDDNGAGIDSRLLRGAKCFVDSVGAGSPDWLQCRSFEKILQVQKHPADHEIEIDEVVFC
jgi:hypothetical protein